MKDRIQAVFAHKSGRVGVIIVTSAILLATLLSVVDQYDSRAAELDAAQARLTEATREARELPKLKDEAARVTGQLAMAETALVGDHEAGPLRHRLVEAARRAGLQIRRIEVGNAAPTEWPAANPTTRKNENRKANKAVEPYVPRRRSIRLTAVGTMESIRSLFEGIRATEKTMRLEKCRLHAEKTPSQELVAAEIELSAFDVAKRTD